MMNATEHYLDQYRALANALPGCELDWLQDHRAAGLARFEKVGFPTQRDEDWRYTTVAPITSKLFRTQAPPESPKQKNDAPKNETQRTESLEIEGLQSHRLVFVDGLFAPELSDPALSDTGDDFGIVIQPLARVLEECPERIEHTFGTVAPPQRHGFTALNNAFSQDGVVVLLEPHASVAKTIEMLFISDAKEGFSQPRNLIIAGQGSRARIIERHVSRHVSRDRHNTFTNSTTEISLGKESQIDYYLMQMQSADAYHVCGIWARQDWKSRFSCRTITLGGALVRNDLGVMLAGEEAHCDLFGLYNIAGTQHTDNHTTVVHNAPHCSSHELYKGVLEQRSRAVFHGRIRVDPGAQKTDAAQTNNNLLLSANAEIDTKPQLEIYADDVKCAHGATVGRMDEDALFYLRTRGIDHAQARALLTFAFVNDVVNQIEIDALRDTLESILATRLTPLDPPHRIAK